MKESLINSISLSLIVITAVTSLVCSDEVSSATSVCNDSCAAQAALRCSDFLGKEGCDALCEELANEFPDCTDLWLDLNRCMAVDHLVCDPEGAANTINLKCRDIRDQWDECAFGEPIPERDPNEDACSRSCIRGSNLNCPNENSIVSCFDGCVGIAKDECGEEWIDLMECVADDTNLECDASGQSSTSDPECLDLSDKYFKCSAPGQDVAPPSQACSSQKCNGQCCNDVCVDTQNDRNDCGVCGRVCAVEQVCVDGDCRCGDPEESLCDNQCVNLQTDSNNCGECGKSCGQSAKCENGVCSCLSDTDTFCDDECVDLNSDRRNCGECGNACLSTPCESGECG